MKASRIPLAALACAAAFAIPSLSFAQKKVPGEKWRQTVSMEASGMKMPGRTVEVCVPVGKAEEALARPPENNDCKLSDVQRSGNKFAANIACTGQNPVKGRIESTSEGNRTLGKMQMQMEGMAMTMNFDSTKLGTACEALDYSDYKPPVVQMPAVVDMCASMADRVKSDPKNVGETLPQYLGANAQCGKHASFKSTFCPAVQTPAGFSELAQRERSMSGAADRTSEFVIPLTSAARACGFGGADALRTKLLPVAEKDGAWDFLVAEGNDATFAMLTATAKRECSGRSFTNSANARYAGLCRNYGVMLARGDLAAARQAAGVYESSGSGSAGTPVGPTSSTAPAERPAAQPAGDAAAEADADEATDEANAKSKARDALDKGKQKLRNIFGGG